jgi:hypothetical protein
VTAADGRRECTRRGCHGRGERCARGLPQTRLLAAPRDPAIPTHAAWRTPVPELAAWCARCHDAATAPVDHGPARAVADRAWAGVFAEDGEDR